MSLDFEATARAMTNGVVRRGVTESAEPNEPDLAALNDIKFEVPKDQPKGVTGLKATTPRDVFERWKTTGPLVHEPTGFAALDERTGGGLVFGSRVYVLGAPDAGKTAFVVQLVDLWAQRGVVVGLLAVDEEDDDVVTRLVQRLVLPPAASDLDMDGPLSRERFSRQDCEHRVPCLVAQMAEALGDPPVRLYSGDWTIEAAAADLNKYARSLATEGNARRSALFIDSIQTVTCAALLTVSREPSPREVINANVRAVRTVAGKYGMLVAATSEMNRNAYRDATAADDFNDLAAGKESGAIEYSGRVLISLRSVKDDSDLVQVRLPKNKQGPGWRTKADDIYLRIDRAAQTLSDAEAPVLNPTNAGADNREADRRCAVLKLVQANPGRGTKALRQLAKDAGLRVGNDALDATLEDLVGGGRVEDRGTAAAHRFFVRGVPDGAGHRGGTSVDQDRAGVSEGAGHPGGTGGGAGGAGGAAASMGGTPAPAPGPGTPRPKEHDGRTEG